MNSHPKSLSEKFIAEVDSTRYPSNASLLESINSNCEQQFDKVSKVIINKIVSLNKEFSKKLDELPTRDDIAQINETQEQEYQKRYEHQIESLKRVLNHQQAIHDDNSKKLKQLQDNSHYQYSVLYSVFICFLLAILSLCLYNAYLAFLIVFICFNLYHLSNVFYTDT